MAWLRRLLLGKEVPDTDPAADFAARELDEFRATLIALGVEIDASATEPGEPDG